MSTEQPLLSIKNVYKVFGDDPEQAMKMLDEGHDKDSIFDKTGQTVGVMDASFSVNKGEIFVVMGLSGSGKSTMVRLLNRLIEPTSGSIELNGKNVTQLSSEELLQVRRKEMSMVFQSFALMPHMTVQDNTAFGLEISGVDQQERERRAKDSLSQVGLSGYEDSYPHQLSGGMQQRVGLARALANDPTILLMDEAFSALDPLIRTEMQDELVRLQREQERTIVFISHDLDEAIRIGDRIAIMEGGRVVQVGTPQEILRNPADDYVEMFFKGVDPGKVLKAGDVAERKPQEEIIGVFSGATDTDQDYQYVVDEAGTFLGLVNTREAPDELVSDFRSINAESLVNEVLDSVARSDYAVPVLDQAGCYQGNISKQQLLQTLHNA
ncbi:glycine betaine/L-proline ABC transporter ATP-binding protein ProV [Motiliproteus sp. MSK22-1]|uniref:glycine betaine/L-proline ABC transporter ATP-binding protein ProV n=1 Tax=Motiliproteus sp. MSK22-1 TaxID=1897630 RepID=UPI0009768948|nr:glycine betaine/L-proline ABC transporter ATP-binding protein ProV [Motiliproteus sp. MSK22-1]OMH36271.1 glycine/betaine ABC transporter ATP-binding protein [Motiliproteus sp. MSK22-1]